MSTNSVSAKNIKRAWHLMDAKDQTLGRFATQVAKKLSGKDKVNYVPYLDQGDYVVIINASKIKVSGKKSTDKKYVRHSGYPGGLTVETFDKLIVRRPEAVLEHAIKGMLPKSNLGRKMIKKLYIYPTDKHPHAKQLGIKEDNPSTGAQDHGESKVETRRTMNQLTNN